MSVTKGKLSQDISTDRKSYPPNALTITIQSEVRRPDRLPASISDEVASIHVVVTVENDTDQYFMFPSQKVVLDISKNGKSFDEIATKGPAFEMTPRGRMSATFDRAISQDGDYSWLAKTWYYLKPSS